MSIMRCEKHGHWDSDFYEECPSCLATAGGGKRPLTEDDIMGPGVLMGREGEIIETLRERVRNRSNGDSSK